MNRFRRVVCWLCAIGTVITAGWVSRAGPILPANPPLTPEIQSLAGIRSVKIGLDVRSALLRTRNYSGKNLEKFERMIREGGLMLSDDDSAPFLRIAIQTTISPTFPKAVSVTYLLSLEQDVMIERIGKRFRLSTYSLIHTILAPRGRLIQDLDLPAAALVARFIARVKSASDAIAVE